MLFKDEHEERDKQVHQAVAKLLRSNKDQAAILDTLRSQGFDDERAQSILAVARQVQQDRSSGFLKMLIGGCVLALGLAITLGTYLAAKEGGGVYVVTLGFIVFGAVEFFIGYSQWRS